MSSNNGISRREFLRTASMIAAGGVLMACAPATVAPAAGPTATPAPYVKGDIRIVPSGVQLPTEKVTFRWLDSGDTKAVFWKQFFAKYQEAYPNITVQYDGLPWNEIGKIVPLGIQNGNLHDVFSIPQGITNAQAYTEGWLMPYDDLLPDLAEIKAKYPPGSFVEGINVFDGKTYCLPHATSKRTSTMLLYNQDYLQEAGYDPSANVMTWDDYRAAAKKVTENGKGQYYGVIIGGNQLNRWGAVVRDLATFAGVPTVGSTLDDMNLLTGEYNFTTPEYIAAMELLLAMRDDGSFFPGYLSINAPQARAQIAQGGAGMILQGLWCLPQWKAENPEFNWNTAHTPLADPANVMPLHVSVAVGTEMWIYAKSELAAIAADIMHYWTSLEGQLAWNKVAGVSDPGYMVEAMETASDDPRELKALETQNGMYRVGPSPLIRNLDVAMVNQELRAVTPNFNEVIQGLMAGQIEGVQQQFQDLQDRANAELDRAIKAAQDKGANVSRDDYVFSNWDPKNDYTEADYAAA
ncbi:MAG: extracellular solute-binding protein [Caldilinea sp.]|nr:extracellular solute-binding protein [Caldilinea sp.]MCB0148511.1 extracellular solute-binding protein [Caldilineaceae bacterium]MCB0048528.1 extracellular solute-binding protein [Caldilinea sp.]MCB9114061.1 extracellular solute-binding protein [Caldilineaceae bacterium]MCO5211289.1 extracellular solute-binding protein [Caldilinea sp.]